MADGWRRRARPDAVRIHPHLSLYDITWNLKDAKLQEPAFLRHDEHSVDTLNLHNIVGSYYNSERLDSDTNPRKDPNARCAQEGHPTSPEDYDSTEVSGGGVAGQSII